VAARVEFGGKMRSADPLEVALGFTGQAMNSNGISGGHRRCGLRPQRQALDRG
jgi:hypothetical protein